MADEVSQKEFLAGASSLRLLSDCTESRQMSMDVATPFELVVTIGSYLAVIVLTFFIGYAGPTLDIRETTENFLELRGDQAVSRFFMSFRNLKPYNRYQVFSVTFRRQVLGNHVNALLSMNLTLKYLRSRSLIREVSRSRVLSRVIGGRVSFDSVPFYFAREGVVDYDELVMNVSFHLETRAFDRSVLTWEYASSKAQILLFGVHSAYLVIECFFLLFLWMRLSKVPRESWRVEQTLTVGLLGALILMNLPFEFAGAYVPATLLRLFVNFTHAFVIGYVIFYLLALFHLVAEKNEATGDFFRCKFFFAALFVVFSGMKNFLRETRALGSAWTAIAAVVEGVLAAWAAVWLLVRTVVMAGKSDETERYVVKSYVGAMAFLFVVWAVDIVWIRMKPQLGTKPLHLLVTHAIVNLLGLYMTELHFPSTADEEKVFEEAGDGDINVIKQALAEELARYGEGEDEEEGDAEESAE
jgi:hypothetical protein